MIVRVFGDGTLTDVPVTPDTTCSDLIECCRDPGEESCELVAVCPEYGGMYMFMQFPDYFEELFTAAFCFCTFK